MTTWSVLMALLLMSGLFALEDDICDFVPGVEELMRRLRSFKTLITVGGGLFGLYRFIWCLWHVAWFASYTLPLSALLIGGAVQFVLGFFLGYEVIAEYTFGRRGLLADRLGALRKRVEPFQKRLGVAALVIAALLLVIFLFKIQTPRLPTRAFGVVLPAVLTRMFC